MEELNWLPISWLLFLSILLEENTLWCCTSFSVGPYAFPSSVFVILYQVCSKKDACFILFNTHSVWSIRYAGYFCVFCLKQLPYARHYNPLLISKRSWIPTIHKARILRKKPLKKKFLDSKKWVKSIQTAGNNGARTEYNFDLNLRQSNLHYCT